MFVMYRPLPRSLFQPCDPMFSHQLPAMFTNRISRYVASPIQNLALSAAGFAACPTFAAAGDMQQMIYRLAYEQAQRQVAVQRRMEALRTSSYRWN